MNNIHNAKKFYFIGIGGIGVSALARMMLARGKDVSGSDLSETVITKELEKASARVFIGGDENNISEDIDVVIYTIAIPDTHAELKKARSLRIPTISYPEALGIISKGMFTIAVSGTHGKTTTTAMIAKILIDAGLSPTVIVGSLLSEYQSNFIAGTSDIFVVEACEYKRSFLHLTPSVLVITNIDNDHLDYYKDLADIQNAFNELARKVSRDGYIIANPNDEAAAPALAGVSATVIDYAKEDVRALTLKVSGAHNIKNAQAALAAARAASRGLPREAALQSLNDFRGTWRRFEYKGKTEKGALIYDDYAHHPTEIRATLAAAREKFPKQKIIVAFQPHLYSRTKLLLDDFASSFKDADEVIIAPIYAAREAEDESINSNILAHKIKQHGKKACSPADFDSIAELLRREEKIGDVIFTMGAGDIFKVGESFVTRP